MKKVDAVMVICALVVTGLAVWKWRARHQPTPERTIPFPAALWDGGAYVGDSSAPYEVTIWTDYQCPACARLERELVKVRAALGDSLLIVYRDLPAVRAHGQALPAAVAAECAARQQQFEPMHDALFREDSLVRQGDWVRLAEIAGVPDSAAFSACTDEPGVEQAVMRDVRQAMNLGFHGTPTLMIGGRVHLGGMPAADLLDEIRSEEGPTTSQ